MRKIIKEFNVYSYDELSLKAKEEAKSQIFDIIYKFNEVKLTENLLDYISINYGITLNEEELSYRLIHSQGDGVCFTYNSLLSFSKIKEYLYKDLSFECLNSFEKIVVSKLSKEDLNMVYTYLSNDYTISIRKENSIYYDSYSCSLQAQTYLDDDIERQEKINNCIEFTLCRALLEPKYNFICRELENIGYALLEVTEEDIISYIKDSNIEFLENGDIYSL